METTIPRSGQVLAGLADVLGIERRSLAKNGMGDRTVSRFLAGDRLSAETLNALLANFTREVLAEYGDADKPPPSDRAVHELTRVALRLCRFWDARVARINLEHARAPSVAPRALARLVAVDLGMRAGAAVLAGYLDGALIDDLESATRPNFLRHATRAIRRPGDNRSDAELAEACGVTTQNFSNWMTGDYPPSPAKLVELLAALSPDWKAFAPRLTIQVALARVVHRIVAETSATIANDLVRGFFHTAKMTNHGLAGAQVSEELRAAVARELVSGHSPSTPVAKFLQGLSALAPNRPWGLDILSVRGDWAARLRHWSHLLSTGMADEYARFFPSAGAPPQPPAVIGAIDLELDDLVRFRVYELMSVGDFRTAAEMLRQATAKASADPVDEYNFGLALSRSATDAEHDRRREAVAAFERAAALDPSYAEAFLEHGVTLIDLGDLERAETSLLHARDLGADAASVLYHLALVADLRGADPRALELYDQALNENPDYADAAHNAALLAAKLGRARDADRFRKIAAHVGDTEV